MAIAHIHPVSGTEADRRTLLANAANPAATPIAETEVHCSTDGAGRVRFFRANVNIGRTYYLGAVASEAAMLALDQISAGTGTAAALPGDWCYRSDLRRAYRCTSGYGTAAGDWEQLPQSLAIADVAGLADALAALPTTYQPLDADLTAIAAQGVSAFALTLLAASGATAAKALLSLQQSDISGLVAALAAKWGTPVNASILGGLTAPDGVLLYDGSPVGAGWSEVEMLPSEAASAVDLVYSYAGDAYGVAYAIATSFGMGPWSNPAVLTFASSGKVGALRSSDGYGNATWLLNRSPEECYTGDAVGQWLAFDLGEVSLRPNCYTLRHRGGSDGNGPIRTWKLQGCNSISEWSVAGIAAGTWIDLDVRAGDTTMPATPSAWATYAMTQPSTGYRFLRVIQTGPNAYGNNYLLVCEVEFYGLVTRPGVAKLPVNASGWLTDGGGHYVPWYE